MISVLTNYKEHSRSSSASNCRKRKMNDGDLSINLTSWTLLGLPIDINWEWNQYSR